jgi:hypothetical protein
MCALLYKRWIKPAPTRDQPHGIEALKFYLNGLLHHKTGRSISVGFVLHGVGQNPNGRVVLRRTIKLRWYKIPSWQHSAVASECHFSDSCSSPSILPVLTKSEFEKPRTSRTCVSWNKLCAARGRPEDESCFDYGLILPIKLAGPAYKVHPQLTDGGGAACHTPPDKSETPWPQQKLPLIQFRCVVCVSADVRRTPAGRAVR